MVTESGLESKNLILHQNEVINTINKLKLGQTGYENTDYFLKLARQFTMKRHIAGTKPRIAVIGINVPEELIYATGAEPLWILGGSFAAALAADVMVPRDTDSVSKAALGYLVSDIFEFTKGAELTVIPITSDSMRKIVPLLAKSQEIFIIDLPPLKEDPLSLQKWLLQMKLLTKLMEQKTHRRCNGKRLCEAIDQVNRAKLQMKRLLDVSMVNPGLISGVLVMLIINTYYFTVNLREWVTELQCLNDELSRRQVSKASLDNRERPRILIVGSPVYFPNFKLPLLLQELGVDHVYCAQEITTKINTIFQQSQSGVKRRSVFEKLVSNSYLADCSGAFVDGKKRLNDLKTLIKQGSFHGVVYHVLKGQIEYDFELDRYERLLNELDIPFFRLETDYQQQDVEQLKIRLEAFREMIEAKYFKKRA
ncbi:MAG: 2-hydroxyacyl-CoA dehydratase family protein [Bacillota bacterium]|jgi:benzoyl-CoA reductase/2-hydroxyglutaryl-CoA dehydratase subunit BcrC/BadD/HgdB